MALRQRSRDRLDRDDEHGGPGSWLPLVVAAVALLGLGAWIGRASQPAQEPPAPPETTTPEDDASIDWPGPTNTENGVPVAYDRTKAGAVAAAVQYARVSGQADADRLGEILDVIAAEEAREDLRTGMESSWRRVQEGLGLNPDDPDYVVVNAVAGYSVESYKSTAATVQVWGTGFIVDPQIGTPGAELETGGWSTTTITLQWERGDWRLSKLSTADGPSPGDANAGNPRRTARTMNQFEEFWHVPSPMR